MERNRIPKLFFSHSSEDRTLLLELVEAARIGLNLQRGDIRCSSLDGYGFITGTSIIDRARDEGRAANSLIAVITPNSLKSSWVLFEMGARWGSDKHLAVVLANGSTFKDIPDPISRNFSRVCTEDDLVALFVDIADELNVTFDVVAARRHLKTAEKYSHATAQKNLTINWERNAVTETFKASARAKFVQPQNESIVPTQIEYEIDFLASPAPNRSLWLCVEYAGNLWPKSRLKHDKATSKGLLNEGGTPPAGAFSLSVVEVDEEGERIFEEWFETGKKTTNYPAFESVKGARVVEVNLILDKTI